MGNKLLEFRKESDALGEIQIPSTVYWGAATGRAQERLYGCGPHIPLKLLEALILIKKAITQVNNELGRLEPNIAEAIVKSCDEILAGKWHAEFVAEPYQSGSGLTIVSNINEVLANRAEEILGGKIGEYKLVKPFEHVHLGQSQYDIFASAMRLAASISLRQLEPAILDLERLLRRKALEFSKTPRTQEHRIGQELNTYGAALEHSFKRLKEHSLALLDLGFAEGTKENSDTRSVFTTLFVGKLSTLSNLKLRAEDLIYSAHALTDFLQISSCLKEIALELDRIADNLRLRLGKGNDLSLADTLNMVTLQIIASDLAMTLATKSSHFEANTSAPVIICNLLKSSEDLRLVILAFNQKCLAGIHAQTEENL